MILEQISSGAVLQVTLNGIVAGSIYALVACGFSLIYTTNRFLHIAHGVTVALGAYFIYLLFTLNNFPFPIAVILTLILTSLSGLLMYLIVYEPMKRRGASNIVLLIASLGILFLVENLIVLGFGPGVRNIGLIEVKKGIEIFGAFITPAQIGVVICSLVLLILLYLFLKKTKLGKDLRAVSDNYELANIVGISSRKVAIYSFLLGSFLAGVAGILIGVVQIVEPTMGTKLIIKGFAGAVIGGIASVPSSILGSYVLGLVENYGILLLPSEYKDAIAFVGLFLILLLKPSGLFGGAFVKGRK